MRTKVLTPGWMTYDTATDIAFLTRAPGGWPSALATVREELRPYPPTSKAKAFLYLRQLRDYITRQSEAHARAADQERRERLEQAVALLRDVVGEPNPRTSTVEDDAIRYLIPILEGDAPDLADMMDILGALGTVDAQVLLEWAVELADKSANEACAKRDYGTMSRESERAHRIDQLRRELY